MKVNKLHLLRLFSNALIMLFYDDPPLLSVGATVILIVIHNIPDPPITLSDVQIAPCSNGKPGFLIFCTCLAWTSGDLVSSNADVLRNLQEWRSWSHPNQIPEPAAGGNSGSTPTSPWMFKLLIISPKAPESSRLRSLTGHHLMAHSRGLGGFCLKWDIMDCLTRTAEGERLISSPAWWRVSRALCPCHPCYFSSLVVIWLVCFGASWNA